ncbi:tRNA (guanosine(46)-N7)-methyltransferase TrmB [Collinsella tanakaei]|uniref:tRNA (guanosine(46)-N7)-methyltransferase TrmB n=1 Tax=Collinsella tanakaei TaxID=626935 RepID=UPI00195DC464|nr:tRNA (guanosine(46)-N7)-methyltransferase TrmB [Collinsella tanakaei]MBM6778567.1 tRNA (guanosine(46)-N7)-methyltransferase TrmB [Collinsella tanakaei]
MGLTHIRLPKNFNLDERLERYADAIETHAPALAGRWAQDCWPLGVCRADGGAAYSAVHLDLGCGKGSFIAQCAAKQPDVLYIGMDVEPICIAYAAQRAIEDGLRNMVLVPRGADALPKLFAAGELAGITLNFPTPYPKRHHARRRLVNVDHLLGFRQLLAPGGTITLRTDSQPLWEYAKAQFEAAGYELLWVSADTRAEHPEFPETEYERRLTDKGARVYGICASPGPEPDEARIQAGRDAEQSLMCYLPDDLFSLDYVPLGMEAAVENFRNRERKGKTRIPETDG